MLDRLKYPVSAHIYPTFKCNLKCKHCLYDCKPNSKTMPFENVKIVVEKLQRLRILNVNINGGEPLLHPQFDDIVRLINNKNFGWGLFTNATLMTPEKAKIIAENEPYSVAISLHGGDESTHNWLTGGGYWQTIEGIKNLRKYYDGKIKINSLMHPKRNEKEFLSLVKFCEEYDLKLNADDRLIPLGRAWKNWGILNKKPNFDYNDLIPKANVTAEVRDLSKVVVNGILADMLPNKKVCSAGNMEIYIDPDGFVYGCIHFINDRNLRRMESNILYEDPLELWRNYPSLNDTTYLYPLGCFYKDRCPLWGENKCPHCVGVSLQLFKSPSYPHPACFDYIKYNIDPEFTPVLYKGDEDVK